WKPSGTSARSSTRSTIFKTRLPALSKSRRRQPGKSAATLPRRPRGATKSPRISPASPRRPAVPPRAPATPRARLMNCRAWLSACKRSLHSSSTRMPPPASEAIISHSISATLAGQATGTPSQMLALVIDDSRTARLVIGNMLRELGMEVVTAANGVEGLAQLDKNPHVELILLDWNMPEMNGLDFLRTVRSQEAYRHIRILMA